MSIINESKVIYGGYMRTLKIKDIVLGEGRPKVCVPVVAGNIEGIKEQINEIALKGMKVDLVELRVDYLNNFNDVDYIHTAVNQIKEVTGKPVILTFRTGFEGGNIDISRKSYAELLMNILKENVTDILDLELFTGDDYVRQIVEKAHKCNVKVLMSNHDFNNTPDSDEIVSRLDKMNKMGADIVKIAVMPHNSKDVITLLSATEKAVKIIDKPVVTMSMSELGLISRLSGEIFGSAITFGAVKELSAPGQIDVDSLNSVLDIIHNN